MEYNLNDLKKKKVINVADGRDLGKITDLVLTYPDGKVKAFIVPGRKNGFFFSGELIINFKCVERIGDDAILVSLREKPPTESKPVCSGERYDEE